MSRTILHVPQQGSAGLPSSLAGMAINHRVCHQCSHRSRANHLRPFSSSSQRSAAVQNPAAGGSYVTSKQNKQESMQTRMSKMTANQIGNDLGRLPGTIILPEWKDYPKGIKAIARLHWKKFMDTLVGTGSIFYLTKWDVPKDPRTGRKIRQPTRLGERLDIARKFHKSLNMALAHGNEAVLKEICASGMRAQCQKVVKTQRQEGKQFNWSLLTYEGIEYWKRLERWPIHCFLPFSAVRVVSDKMTTIPFRQHSSIRECIVRIRSTQQLESKTSSEQYTKSLTEYIVLQRFVLEGKVQPWKIWGTIDLSNKDLDSAIKHKASKTMTTDLASTFKSRIASLTGIGL